MSRKFTFLIILTFFLIVAGVSAYFFWSGSVAVTGDNGQTLPADGKLHMLILGVDPGWVTPGHAGTGRSDTIMLATYDPKTGEVSLLSIPRDTRVAIPGHGEDKINAAYAYGGVELAMQTVRNFLNVPIQYYVKIDTTGFSRLVDAIGGVTIDVEKDMNWDDNAGNLHIHLQKGLQTLNGAQAEGYVRFRHTDSDFARAARQQKFIAAALKQVLTPANLLKIPTLMRIGFQTVQTNIPLPVALRYSTAIKSVQADKVASYTVEGSDTYIDGVYYMLPNVDKMNQLIETTFYAGIDRTANGQVKVIVRYGNGSRSSADKMAQLLEKLGFQVLSVSAADRSDYQVTQVLSTKQETAGAVSVAEAISAPEVLLDTQAGTTADVIVIVGKDMLP